MRKPFEGLTQARLEELKREASIYRKLEGLAGIPRLLVHLPGRGLVVEYAEGRSCRELKRGELSEKFHWELRQIVEQMHRRGVAHCDLRSRRNILVIAEGRPWVVDLVSAYCREGRGLRGLREWLFRQFRREDLAALVRLKRQTSPHLVTEEEAGLLSHPGWKEQLARVIGQRIRKLMRALARYG